MARLAAPFGLRVAAFDPVWDEARAARAGVERVGLDELPASSDFVSVNCPLTPETRGLLSRERLALMKRTAFLINTGRGAVIDEEALADALESGGIAGAALDVFATEPLPDDHRFHRTRNLILTPHAIGVCDEMYLEYMDCVERAIRVALDGGIPAPAVNAGAIATPGSGA